MQSITAQESKREIISKYEIGLSELLYKNGFKSDVFINAYENINNITVIKWRQLIENYHMPFLKCSVPKLLNREITTADGWEDILSGIYPIELIERHIKRIGLGNKNKNSCSVETKRKFFDFVSNMPSVFRKIIIKIVFIIFPFIKD